MTSQIISANGITIRSSDRDAGGSQAVHDQAAQLSQQHRNYGGVV